MPEPIPYKNEVLRKALHMLLSIAVFSLVIWEPKPLIILFLVLTAIYLSIDISRLKFQPVGVIYKKIFGILVRNEESSRLTGASFAFVGASITLLLFDTVTAISAILIIGLSDAMAAIVGRKYGHTRIGRKSLEGSFAFFLVTLLILYGYTGMDISKGLIISFACTILELLLPEWLNDNFMIPIAAGLLITIL
ncbi:MAG: dolichol kinase [Candidatus Marinimicrobia bacterium]|nr:dolichol kinase [Candidatus Neomarinimicrobiota bacterium]